MIADYPPVDPDFLKKSDFPGGTQNVIETTREQIGLTELIVVFSAQRSAMSARQRVVSRQTDKYRVECALPTVSVFIRVDSWLIMAFPGVSQ
jgi:hypothetical protein